MHLKTGSKQDVPVTVATIYFMGCLEPLDQCSQSFTDHFPAFSGLFVFVYPLSSLYICSLPYSWPGILMLCQWMMVGSYMVRGSWPHLMLQGKCTILFMRVADVCYRLHPATTYQHWWLATQLHLMWKCLQGVFCASKLQSQQMKLQSDKWD